MEPREIMQGFLDVWSAQDVDSAMAFLSEDCVYSLKISETALPFAGEQVGREAVRAAFYAILKDWDYLYARPTITSVEGSEVRVHYDYRYRYRRTGDELSGGFRAVVTVEDGLITRIDEYHDAARVEAFMRMVSAKPTIEPPFTGGETAPPRKAKPEKCSDRE